MNSGAPGRLCPWSGPSSPPGQYSTKYECGYQVCPSNVAEPSAITGGGVRSTRVWVLLAGSR